MDSSRYAAKVKYDELLAYKQVLENGRAKLQEREFRETPEGLKIYPAP